MKKLAALGAAFATLLSPVSASALMSCSIGSTTAVSFGVYDIFSATPLDSAGTLTYRCNDVSGADSIVIQLSRGSSSSFLPRTLTQGLYEFEYNLYLDPARTSVWGDGTSGTSEYGPIIPADGVNTDVTIYGRIPAGQNARVGTYTDTIVVTLVF